MATEILNIPEQYLKEVIIVIRAGLNITNETISSNVKAQLTTWCNEEEEYINNLGQSWDEKGIVPPENW